jgi:hypothetical protein
VQPVLGQVVDLDQHIGEPRLRIDIVHFGRLCRMPNYAERRRAGRTGAEWSCLRRDVLQACRSA